MNEQNTKQLLADFPRLYRDYYRPVSQTCMCWGFSCNDGWFDLIYKLSKDIEAAAAAAGIDRESNGWPRATQVKEKFGTLRYYIDVVAPPEAEDLQVDQAPAPSGFIAFRPVASVKAIRDLVATAEAASATICEECGAPGQLHIGGYWHTTCDRCEAEKLERNKGAFRESFRTYLTDEEIDALDASQLSKLGTLTNVLRRQVFDNKIEAVRDWFHAVDPEFGVAPVDLIMNGQLDELLIEMGRKVGVDK